MHRNRNYTPLIKYSDDSALVDLSNSDSIYFDEVQNFSQWCKSDFLDLNVKKTKELLIDFRTNQIPVPELLIDGSVVERVTEYKYLGTILDYKLNFDANTNSINKKCQSRIYCLQKLRKLNVDKVILQNFYRAFIESVLTFGFICWYGSLSVSNKKVLQRVVKVCEKVVGEKQLEVQTLYESRVRMKAKAVHEDESHSLAKYFELMPSGRRFRVPHCKSLRMKRTFVPQAVEILNRK